MRGKLWITTLSALSLAAMAQGQTWERLGPEGGLVVSLGVSSNDTLYLGTADGHVFVREKGAGKWQLRGRVGTRTDAVVTRLLLPNARNENQVFAAVWYQDPAAGGGVFRSEDAGNTWKPAGLQGEAVRALEVAPSKPDELIAGTRSGVFLTSDNGKTWERISLLGDEEIRNLDSVAIDPADPNTIYAGTYHLPWKTTDGGKTWKPAAAGLIDDSDIMSLRVDVTDPSRLYLSACSGIYRSENQGDAWTKLQGIPYAARRTQAIVQDPAVPQTLYAATTEGLWVTHDGGENWHRTTPREWVVNSAVVLGSLPGQPGSVVIGTEAQGVLVSTDAGEHFAPANDGFTHTAVKQLVGAWHEPRHLLMVLARRGQQIWESRDAGTSWTPVTLLAQTEKKDSPLNPEEVAQLHGTPWGWLLRGNDGRLWLRDDERGTWSEWKLTQSVPMPRAPRNSSRPPVKLSAIPFKTLGGPLAFNGSSLWISSQNDIAKCTRGGACTILRAFRETAVSALLLSDDAERIYAIAGSRFGLSTDDGETVVWHELPGSVRKANWIAIDSTSKTLFLGTDHGLYASTDEGMNWQKHIHGIPEGRVEQWLAADGLLTVTLGDGGIYISRDQGASWTRADYDAQRSRFTGLVQLEPGVILAGSQGEGILRLTVKRQP